MGSASFWAVWAYNFAFDAGRYVVAAVGAFLVFWVWGRERFRRRLVNREYAPGRHLRREIAYSTSTAVVFSLVGTGIVFGTRAGVFHVYTRVATHGWAYLAFSVVVLLVLQDGYFYWTHRAMHHPWFFRWMHLAHHRSHNPSPFAAYAFSPAEALVHAAFVPAMLVWMPLHTFALFAFLAVMILRNVLGHLGIELFPRGFARGRLSGWSTTTTHHALHHRRSSSNFGLYLTVWDRLMGTTDPAYGDAFEAIASRAPEDAESRAPASTCKECASKHGLHEQAPQGPWLSARVSDGIWVHGGPVDPSEPPRSRRSTARFRDDATAARTERPMHGLRADHEDEQRRIESGPRAQEAHAPRRW